MKFVFSFFLMIGLSSIVIAQESNTNNQILTADASSSTPSDWMILEDDGAENWVFYQNTDNSILYIDFEEIGKKLDQLVLKDLNKAVVKSDYDLFELPINTIYELNLENLPRGTYIVELQTFEEKIIRETITIK